jgi:hypothetical protein
MRLSKRRNISRQGVLAPEVSERQPRSLVRRGASGNQLPPAVIKMQREFFDDLRLAGGRKA